MDANTVKLENVFFNGSEDNRLCGTLYHIGTGSKVSDDQLPPIILMHGGGQTRHSWHGTAIQLAMRGHRAITVDARGHGESEWVPSQNYSFDHFQADLRHLTFQIAERWGSAQRAPVVVGASMGGLSAMFAQAPERDEGRSALFSAIVLVDITPRMERTGVEKIMGFMSKDMRSGFETIEQAAEAVASYMPHREKPKSLDGLRKNLRQKEDGRWYWHWDPAFVDGPVNISHRREDGLDELFHAVRQIKVPTLLVRGGKSELVSKEAADEFLDMVPHAKFVDVTDAGHMVAGDKNDIFASAVLDFLEAEFTG